MERVRDNGRDDKCPDHDEEARPELVQVLGERRLIAMTKPAKSDP